jgi:hypothetical protein
MRRGHTNHPAKKIVKQSLNKVNIDMVRRRNGDVKNLYRALGYDESQDLDVGVMPKTIRASSEL